MFLTLQGLHDTPGMSEKTAISSAAPAELRRYVLRTISSDYCKKSADVPSFSGAAAAPSRMRAGSNAAKHDFLLRRRSHHAHAICLMLVAACSVIISNGVIEQCFPLDESPLQRQGLAHIAVARRGRYVLLVCALFLQRRPKAIMMSVYDIYSNRRPSAPVPIPPHAQSVRTQPSIGRTSSTLTPP